MDDFEMAKADAKDLWDLQEKVSDVYIYCCDWPVALFAHYLFSRVTSSP